MILFTEIYMFTQPNKSFSHTDIDYHLVVFFSLMFVSFIVSLSLLVSDSTAWLGFCCHWYYTERQKSTFAVTLQESLMNCYNVAIDL